MIGLPGVVMAPPVQQAVMRVEGRPVRLLYVRGASDAAVIDLHGSGWHIENNRGNLVSWSRYGLSAVDIEYTQDIDPLSVQEVLAAERWCRIVLGARHVGVHGFSLGARVAFQAALHPGFDAVSGMAGRVELWDGTQPVLDQVRDVSCPVLIQQGLDDATVPPENAVRLADALRRAGKPFECCLYQGLGHRLDLAPGIWTRAAGFMQTVLGVAGQAQTTRGQDWWD